VALDEHLTTILKHPHSIEAAVSIPHMWRNINQAIEIIDGSNLETQISRALAMWAVLSLHQWVKKAIDSAQSGQVKDTWINKLIEKIENMFYSKDRAGTEITLKSSDFIPGLRECSTKFKKPGLSYNIKGVKEKTQNIAYDVIREWLNYPNDKKTQMQCEFLEIIVSRTQISILLLDIVWIAYRDPFKVILKKSEGRYTPNDSLKRFKERYYIHPFVDPHSEEFKALGSLTIQMEKIFADELKKKITQSQPQVSRQCYS
jgi:hypothetical protein